MTHPPKLSILRGLLFLFDIDNIYNAEKEEIIASKNINDEKELTELLDTLMKPEFLSYTKLDRQWFIDTLEHYLSKEENFDSVFEKLTTYFDDEIENHRQFMRTLFNCLSRYESQQKTS